MARRSRGRTPARSRSVSARRTASPAAARSRSAPRSARTVRMRAPAPHRRRGSRARRRATASGSRKAERCPDPAGPTNVVGGSTQAADARRRASGRTYAPMTNEIGSELGPLLARAHILMFEYDTDGFLLSAVGSCLGADPDVEVRAGLVSPAIVRRAIAGEPVIGRAGTVERVLATAFDVTEKIGPPHLAALRAALAS